ncbi:hypothetical protein F4806DRAFT_268554 [Annulohypoxylon nitens]|nr:hypothetical protein F4806DRAFT_268554 [Annulohypoxylon nitens]
MAAISQPSQNTSPLPRHDHEPRPRPSRTNSTANATVHPRVQRPPSATIRKVPYSGDPTESVADSPVVVPSANPSFRQHTASASTGSASLAKNQKSGGLFAFAAAAIDKTIANISEPTIRSRPSASALSRLSVVLDSPTSSESSSSDKSRIRSFSSNSSGLSTPSLLGNLSDAKRPSQSSLRDPISKPYSETDASRPPPILLPGTENKMHQTSSRLLRMTDDDRPFTKDFKDLFSTLIVSLLPLSAHRVRLTRIEHTFLSEDAINNLGSLKFSQSNRMPDPKDPSRIVTTTTTTTFSMAKDMARSICQRFLDARFIESADGKMQQVYTMKGSVWQLTPKGVCVLDRFCSRNGIQQRQISDLIALGMSYLCILERDS